jgi:hypothetical protein
MLKNCVRRGEELIAPLPRIANEANDAYLLLIERCFEFKKEIIYKGY